MAPAPRRLLPPLALAAAGLALAAVALVVLGAVLPVLIPEAPPAAPVVRAARPAEVRAALDRAAAALRAGDRAGYDAALPVSGPPARRARDEIYRHLVGLPWTSLRLKATPIPGRAGRYDVVAAGQVGGAAPADRIVAERVLEVGVLGGRLVVRGDVTPPAVAVQNVMAFTRPVAISRDRCIVIADAGQRKWAAAIAAACGPARARLTLLGITSRAPIVIYCYASRSQIACALGGDPGEPRIRFFSRPPDRAGHAPTWTRDVGVLGPALKGKEAWTPLMLAHELTHAYTSSWFAGARGAPTLLAEGLATAVEGGRSYAALRVDLASGAPAFPLEEALAAKDLWNGNPIDKVRLAYLEGGSLVLYVLDRWGLSGLRRFVAAVSDSDLSASGLDAAARHSVGVGWDEVRAGWAAFVQTLP